MKRNILVILICLSIAFSAGCAELAWWGAGMVAHETFFAVADAVLGKNTVKWLGMEVHNVTTSLSNRYAVDPNEKGVIVIKVKSESAAEQFGFIEGDLINKINEYETGNIKQFYKATKKVKKAEEVVFDVIRQGDFLTISSGSLKKK